MSRRRRKGNNLLTRILLISVVVHVIAIPILAKFGAFEKIRRQFMTNTVTVLPPPPPEKEKPIERKEAQKKQVAKAKGPNSANKAMARSNAPHPPVVASTAAPSGTGDAGPSIDPNGTGKAGVVPKPDSNPGALGNGGGSQPETKPQPQPET